MLRHSTGQKGSAQKGATPVVVLNLMIGLLEALHARMVEFGPGLAEVGIPSGSLILKWTNVSDVRWMATWLGIAKILLSRLLLIPDLHVW
jgi:hypothetical protein